MGKNINLLGLFSQLDCQSSISRLVEITYKIALAHLRYNHRKFSKIFLIEELTQESVAVSAITPLFCKDSAEQGLPIIKEFNSWQPPIKTEDDALYFLNKIIAGRVEQHISHLFKEQDPFFAKILDSVNYLIKKGGYKKVSYFGNRRICGGRDFNKVHPRLARASQCLLNRQNAQILAVLVYNPYFPRRYLIV